MSSQDDNQDQRVAFIVVIAAVLLSIGLALGFGISKARSGASKPAPVVLTASAAPTAQFGPGTSGAAAPATGELSASAAADDQARVVVDNGVVKFYFASGKTELADGALDALNDAIAAAKAGKNLVISGFHDMTGDAAMNAELAKNRALSVRDALTSAGVPSSSLELQKPAESTGAAAGNSAEARRVEVAIAG